MLIESDCTRIQKNTATARLEVCTNKTRLSFRASGNSTRVTIEGNTAGQAGGGIYLLSSADVLIKAEPHL